MKLEVIRWLASKLKRRDIIGEDGALYLSRYRVIGWMPGSSYAWPFSVYLHNFHRPDLDRALHNHPWRWAVSLILTGGYDEDREGGGRTRKPGELNILTANTFHAVTALHGETWTLFVVGRKTQSWGFNVPGRGFVAWRDRLRERGIEPSY